VCAPDTEAPDMLLRKSQIGYPISRHGDIRISPVFPPCHISSDAGPVPVIKHFVCKAPRYFRRSGRLACRCSTNPKIAWERGRPARKCDEIARSNSNARETRALPGSRAHSIFMRHRVRANRMKSRCRYYRFKFNVIVPTFRVYRCGCPASSALRFPGENSECHFVALPVPY